MRESVRACDVQAGGLAGRKPLVCMQYSELALSGDDDWGLEGKRWLGWKGGPRPGWKDRQRVAGEYRVR